MVGMAAANLQGADKGTRDIDLWFKSTSDGGLDEAARSVGGMFIWRADPPTLSGKVLARIDVVNKCHGLNSFDREYEEALDVEVDDFVVKMLPLPRIIASKTAANRPKDRAALPALSGRAECRFTVHLGAATEADSRGLLGAAGSVLVADRACHCPARARYGSGPAWAR